MGRLPYFVYGVPCYLVFFPTFLYAIGVVGNLVVPKAIDSVRLGSIAAALLIDRTLLGIFAVQHSVMARLAFKDWWTRWVPRPIERSTMSLCRASRWPCCSCWGGRWPGPRRRWSSSTLPAAVGRRRGND